MRAITYQRYGPPEVLRQEHLPRPAPGPGEVLLRVRAAEATKSDCEMRAFRFSVLWFWLPLRLALGVLRPRRGVLGGYFAGEVEALGEGVGNVAPGDELMVCAGLRMGGYGEYATVPAKLTMSPKPRNFSFAEAAAVPLGGLNALHFLRLAEIQPGEAVAINGAGGAIGAWGVQIAKSMGAEVTAVDAARKEAGVRRLGADHFVDFQTSDFTEHGPYDVIFDMVPSSSFARCMRALRPGGRYLAGNARLLTILRCLWANRFTDKTARVTLARETREELDSLRRMIEAGEVGSTVDSILPMEQAAEAHHRVEAEDRVGAIVLEHSFEREAPRSAT